MKHNLPAQFIPHPVTFNSAHYFPVQASHSHSRKSTLLAAYTRVSSRLALRTSQLRPYQIATAVIIASIIPVALLSAQFLLPQTITYSYAQESCIFTPTLFPTNSDTINSEHFALSTPTRVSIGNVPLLSTKTCVQLQAIPSESINETAHLQYSSLLQKKITVISDSAPTVKPVLAADQEVSHSEDLPFSIDSADAVFTYELVAAQQSSPCTLEASTLSCPLSTLPLEQGSQYEYQLKRQLNSLSAPAVAGVFTLRDPLGITDSSIKYGETRYDKPSTLTLTTNKPVASIDEIIMSDGTSVVPVTWTIDESSILITFNSELARGKNFSLTITSAESADGAYLAAPYTLGFTTSTGPKVQGVNIASYNVPVSSNVAITFDSELSAVSPETHVSLTLASTSEKVSAVYSVDGTLLTIRPAANLVACQTYNVTLLDGLENVHGVSGSSAWSMQFRTTCKQSFSIGTSVQGRDITAYRFGTGSRTILFVGGMHGNEKSSVKTLVAWIDELEKNYPMLPSSFTVVIVPDANPDGNVASTRTNSRTVDLNRNFPSNNWTTGVYMPGGVFLENGGGTEPLSEPESRALANLVTAQRPEVVLTYHAVARTVISNGIGSSATLADIYASKSGFAHATSDNEDGVFNYPTTGEFESWLADSQTTATLLVELATLNGNEIQSQKSAMWAILQ